MTVIFISFLFSLCEKAELIHTSLFKLRTLKNYLFLNGESVLSADFQI